MKSNRDLPRPLPCGDARRNVSLAAPWLCLLALCLSSRPSLCATIAVPPVTITQIPAQFAGAAPPYGYESSGFTAAISTGDVVVVRFQAPPGKQFFLHRPPDLPGFFLVDAYWTAGVDIASSMDPHTFTFENLHGTPPVEYYSSASVSDAGHSVDVFYEFSAPGDFMFTALEVRVTVSKQLAGITQTYSRAQSGSAPSWSAEASMEIVDLAVPARTTSWGRLKALYR